MTLLNKKILLGITGAIAAYKSIELIRLLQAQGAIVRVVMTKGAEMFIRPLTFQAISGYPVLRETTYEVEDSGMPHISMARWCDLLLVAPASADFIAQLSYGHAPDLLSTLCLANQSPVIIVPSMNQQMWQNEAVQENVLRLKTRGIQVEEPDVGSQACGEFGPGRMPEPKTIVHLVNQIFLEPDLRNVSILVTAGATREPIDPIRYISNRSSGRMGFALAKAAINRGAHVILISGKSQMNPPAGLRAFKLVETAQQMYEAVMEVISEVDVFLSAAAVSDYRIKTPAESKIKKNSEILTLELEPTTDIILAVSKLPRRPFTIGFALETDNLIEHAKKKLQTKNMDMIIANKVGENTGAETSTNAVTIITKEKNTQLPLASKEIIANQILDAVRQTLMSSGRLKQ